MRLMLPAIVAGLFLSVSSANLRAQTNSAPATTAASNQQLEHEKKLIAFLTPEQQQQYAQARAKALTDNPKLKADGEALIAQADTALASKNPADRQAFTEKMISHRQMLRQAMLKEDGTLGPIFAEIDKHISEMKAKHLGQVQSSPNPSTAPSPAPSAP